MIVHHINSCTLRPLGGPLVPKEMVCHNLVVETSAGVVLVDTGFSTSDVTNAKAHLGSQFLMVARPELSTGACLVSQLKELGIAASDVRHVILTHMDLDHAGGLSDFPSASVHVHRAEFEAATAPRNMLERQRYRDYQWRHVTDWKLHDALGEAWNGFESIRSPIAGVPEILLLPLFGHTRGHTGVVVTGGQQPLLHAGDAYFERADLEPDKKSHAALGMFQRTIAVDNEQRLHNRNRLAELARLGSVAVFSAHAADEFSSFSSPVRA